MHCLNGLGQGLAEDLWLRKRGTFLITVFSHVVKFKYYLRENSLEFSVSFEEPEHVYFCFIAFAHEPASQQGVILGSWASNWVGGHPLHGRHGVNMAGHRHR